ncbi:MAG: YcxB family protein [Hyphomicrobiales bacterium]|nr:YcxB family protein [Hyphomicrobiales bacterium]
MTSNSDDVPRILLRYSLTDEEVRAYFRASAARQQHAVFWPKLSWMAYLGAFPVGLFGASIAIAFGIDPHAFGGLVAALVGLGYICGYYITLMVAQRFRKRLAAALDHPERHEEKAVEITQNGFSQAGSSYQTTFSWNLVQALTSYDTILVLWTSVMSGLVVPRRVLTPNEETSLLALAAHHIGAKA